MYTGTTSVPERSRPTLCIRGLVGDSRSGYGTHWHWSPSGMVLLTLPPSRCFDRLCREDMVFGVARTRQFWGRWNTGSRVPERFQEPQAPITRWFQFFYRAAWTHMVGPHPSWPNGVINEKQHLVYRACGTVFTPGTTAADAQTVITREISDQPVGTARSPGSWFRLYSIKETVRTLRGPGRDPRQAPPGQNDLGGPPSANGVKLRRDRDDAAGCRHGCRSQLGAALRTGAAWRTRSPRLPSQTKESQYAVRWLPRQSRPIKAFTNRIASW